jgi:Transposase DDE domain group 1
MKEQQLDPVADRTSVATMRANQLRLWFASFAYLLLAALRRIGLRQTQFAVATCGTIRLKLFKIDAQVRVSVRRIKIAMASACPYQVEISPRLFLLEARRLLSIPHTAIAHTAGRHSTPQIPLNQRSRAHRIAKRHPHPAYAPPPL